MRMQPMCLALVVLAACTAKEARRTDSAAGSAAPATLAGTPAPDVNAVRQALDAANGSFVAAALKADTVGMAAEFTDDAIVQPGNLKSAVGRSAITSLWAGYAAMETLTAFTLTSQDVIVSGDYAIQVGKYDLTGRFKNGKSQRDIGKFLAVFKKQPDGSYKIVRDAFSSDTLPPR